MLPPNPRPINVQKLISSHEPGTIRPRVGLHTASRRLINRRRRPGDFRGEDRRKLRIAYKCLADRLGELNQSSQYTNTKQDNYTSQNFYLLTPFLLQTMWQLITKLRAPAPPQLITPRLVSSQYSPSISILDVPESISCMTRNISTPAFSPNTNPKSKPKPFQRKEITYRLHYFSQRTTTSLVTTAHSF